MNVTSKVTHVGNPNRIHVSDDNAIEIYSWICFTSIIFIYAFACIACIIFVKLYKSDVSVFGVFVYWIFPEENVT